MTQFPSSHNTGVQEIGSVSDGTPQPEWNVTDDGRGLLTGTLKLFFSQKTGATFEVEGIPKRGDRHPFDERLVCKDVQTSIGSNNICYCDANYVGLAQDPSGVEWSLSCPTEETSITLHPKFVIVDGKEGAWGHLKELSEDGYPTWNYDMVKAAKDFEKTFEGFATSKETIAKDLVGVESYKVPRPTMSITLHTADKNLLTSSIQNVGKQYLKPPFGPDWADTSNVNRTWLFTSLSVTEYAGIYKLETEYTLSGFGSDGKGKIWNKLIYSPA